MAAIDNTRDMVNSWILGSLELQEKLLQLLNEMIKNSEIYKEVGDKNKAKALKEMQKYVGNGGLLETDSIDPKDAGVFRELLKANNVTYVETTARDTETGQDRHLFMTKVDDRAILDKVRNRFKYELNIGVGQLSIEEFARNNEGNTIYSKEGLTRIEAEIFKHNAAREDVSYALAENKKTGLYTVNYIGRDAVGIDRALKNTAFDLAGERGEVYRRNIEQSLINKDNFRKDLKPAPGQTLYVVDSYNPGEFIAINQDGFSTHSLQKQKENGHSFIADANTRSFNNHSELESYITQLRKPKILTEEEMEFVKKIDKKGIAQYVADPAIFKESYIRTMKTLSLKPVVYEPVQVEEVLNPDKQLKGLTNLPQSVCDNLLELISRGQLTQTAIAGNEIAFTIEEEAKVQKVLEQTLFKGLDRKELLQTRLDIEGHGKLDIDSEKTQYIIPTQTPGYLFRLDKEGFHILNRKNPENGHTYARGTKDFENSVLSMIEQMKYPVILSKEEFQMPEEPRAVLIEQRIGENIAQPARDMVFSSDERERAAFISNQVSVDDMKPNQKEAQQSMDRWVSKEYLVDRNFLEKFVDHTSEPKRVHETHRNPNQEVEMDR